MEMQRNTHNLGWCDNMIIKKCFERKEKKLYNIIESRVASTTNFTNIILIYQKI